MIIKDNRIVHKILQDFHVADAFSGLSAKDKKLANSLSVEIEASHSAIINGNHFFYMPKGMSNGARSFVEPYPKPVLVNHEVKSDPIGRVKASDYIKYDMMDPYGITDSNTPQDVLEGIMDFVRGDVFKGKGYKGLGHLQLMADVTNKDAIERILDKRYLTVSIGGHCEDVTCSRCGMDIKKQRDEVMAAVMEGKEIDDSTCMHTPGFKYADSEPTLFWAAGDMSFEELSYVSSPADPNAHSRIMNSKNSGNSITICDIKFGKPETNKISVFISTKDNKESEMKTKLKDFLAKPEDTLKLVKDTLTALGLEKFIVADDKYTGMRRTSFLFADHKVLPIHDKAHILAAYKILETLEDEDKGNTLTQAVGTLDSKFNRVFGETVKREDALTTLQLEAKPADVVPPVEDATANKPNPVNDNATATAVTIDYQKLADEISSRLTDILKTENKDAYDFLTKRVEILEKELEDSLSVENKMTDTLKNYIIDHILTIDKTENLDKLKERTIDSLGDKLKDLKAKQTSVAAVVTPPGTTADGKPVEAAIIADSTVKPSEGGNITKPGDTVTTPVQDKTRVEYLDKKIVSVEYRRLLKAGGFRAAAEYIEQLRKDNKVHPDFILM